jgi:hypothetical protein
MNDEEKRIQIMNKEFKDIILREETKIILTVLKEIFNKDKNFDKKVEQENETH